MAWQWAYSAFGDEKPTTAKTRFANADLNPSFGTTTVPAVTFNLRYPGQYFDQESNLHYNYHRSYSATVGRYTQADPIGLDGGWNRFGYVGQNPLSFTDPEGLYAQALAVCAVWPVGTAICGATAAATVWGAMPKDDRRPPPFPYTDDCNDECKKAIVDAANAYWDLKKKRIPQYETGGTRGREPNYVTTIKQKQTRLKDAIRRVKLHCNPIPTELIEWENAANEPIPN